MRGRLTILSLLAGIILTASTALAASPHRLAAGPGGIGIRLIGVKADSANDPLARSYIVERLAPGTSIRRRVEITNSTRSTADVSLYPAGASMLRGTFGFAPGRSGNELSSWASVSRSPLRLSPNAKFMETVTIDVPQQASSGERYGVIWAEVSAPAPADGGVTLVNRVGVRMYVSIGPGGAAPSSFAIGRLTAVRTNGGAPLIVSNVHNDGRRTLDISGTLSLSGGPGGLRAGPFPVRLGKSLAPNESEQASIRLDRRLPRGPWLAHLRLSSDFVQREATATLRFPRDVGGSRAVSVSSHKMLVAALTLALLAAAVLLARRRRSSARQR